MDDTNAIKWIGDNTIEVLKLVGVSESDTELKILTPNGLFVISIGDYITKDAEGIRLYNVKYI